MTAQTNHTPADSDNEPTPTGATAADPNSKLDQSAPTESVDAQSSSSETPLPIEPGIEEDAAAPSSSASAPNAATQPKISKSTKTTTKPKGKPKPTPKPNRAKTSKVADSDKRAAEEPGATGDAGSATAPDEGAPVLTCLQRAHIEPAAPPPAATLPPQLGSLFPDMMSVSAVLAVTAAAAGHGVRLDTGKNGDGASFALRVAIVGKERHLPQTVAPVLNSAYALEAQQVQRWKADKTVADLKGAADAFRRRLHQQMTANAGLLGFAGLSDSLNPMIVAASSALPRPCFVLRNPVQTEVRRGLEAANQGVLVVESRRMPTMAGWGVNYDEVTADLLNAASDGRPLELADPRADGCVRMRPVAVSVIGTLSSIDSYGLYKAGVPALAATVFVPADENLKFGPTAGAVTTLIEILGRVRALAANAQDAGSPLRLSAAARKTLEQAKMKLARMANEVLPPLAYYYAAAADLVRRIVVVLHVLDHAARQADRVSAEVGKDVVLRATAFVEQCVLPAARSALAVASVAPEVRDARRILSFIQQYCSTEFPLLTRRDVIRIFQRSMSVAAIDRAIRRLIADGLLAPSNPDAAGGGGHVFQVHEAVFAPENQLPDLVTDPRRPRQ
jgi:hypothetical protein